MKGEIRLVTKMASLALNIDVGDIVYVLGRRDYDSSCIILRFNDMEVATVGEGTLRVNSKVWSKCDER